MRKPEPYYHLIVWQTNSKLDKRKNLQWLSQPFLSKLEAKRAIRLNQLGIKAIGLITVKLKVAGT